MAVSDRFNQALHKLQTMFGRHQDAPRSPETVPELAGRRANLEDARAEMAAQRELEGLEPISQRRSSTWVRSGWHKPASGFELVAVVVSVAIIVAALSALLWMVSGIGRTDHAVGLVEGSVVETLETADFDRCRWTVDFELEAEPGTSPRIVRLRIDTVEPSRTMSALSTIPRALPDNRAGGRLVYELFTCPDSIEDIRHGSLRVTYEKTDRGGTRTAIIGF